jgi:hypothetical protein
MSRFFLVLLVGKLFIFLAKKFPPLGESRYEFIRRLFNCGFCSGFWVYTLLAWGTKLYLFDDIIPYVPVLSQLVTGAVMSFFMHLLSLGFFEQFGVIEVE